MDVAQPAEATREAGEQGARTKFSRSGRVDQGQGAFVQSVEEWRPVEIESGPDLWGVGMGEDRSRYPRAIRDATLTPLSCQNQDMLVPCKKYCRHVSGEQHPRNIRIGATFGFPVI